jgi:phage-related protein
VTQLFPSTTDWDDGTADGLTAFYSQLASWAIVKGGGFLLGSICKTADPLTPAGEVGFPHFVAETLSGTNRVGCVRREPYSGEITVQATFQLRAFSGDVKSTHFRQAGIILNCRGGSFGTPTQPDYLEHSGASFYHVRIDETAPFPADTYRLQIVRTISGGSPIVVAESAVLTAEELGVGLSGKVTLEAVLEDDGGSPKITARLKGPTFSQAPGGTLPTSPLVPRGTQTGGGGGTASGGPWTEGEVVDGRSLARTGGLSTAIELTSTDSSGFKLALGGRIGIYGQRERTFSATDAIVMQPVELVVRNRPTGVPIMRDRFERTGTFFANKVLVARNFAGKTYLWQDYLTEQGHDFQSAGEQFGGQTDGRAEPDGSGTGIKIDPVAPGASGGDGFWECGSFIPLSNPKQARKKITATWDATASTDTLFGISFGNYSPWTLYRDGYSAQFKPGSAGSGLVEVRRWKFGSIKTIASASVTLARGTEYVLEFACSQIGGTELISPVSLEVRIDGVLVGLTTASAGITIDDSGVAVDASSDLVSISDGWGYGVAFPDATARPAFLIAQIEDVTGSAGTDVPVDSLPTYVLPKPSDGATGTLSLDYEFAVARKTRAGLERVTFESGHQGRLLRGVIPLREWRLVHGSLTAAEATAWETFWDDHGSSVPFTWTAPEDSVSGTFRFIRDSFSLERVGPVYSMTVDVEEVLS